MKKVFAIFTATLLAISVFGQDEEGFRSSFIEGNQLMEEFSYSVALDIWLDLLKREPNNSNVNYKAGVCLWKLPKRRNESLPYFENAVKNVAERYDPFSPGEKGAPVETYFYIAQAYHLNYKLDSAIVYYNEFKNQINHNHEFWARTSLNIQQCETAKEMILNPVDINVINLGGLVNSKYPDYAPAISLDESALYFTSKRLRSDSSNLYAKNPNDGEFYEDIYVTYKGEDNAWGEPKQINFNTSDNEATLSVSADGESMFIYKAAANGFGDIYVSKLNGTEWSDPVPVGSNINSEYHETHAAMAPDGSRLYFVSNRKGSLKFPDKAHERVESRDIYFCNKLPTGDWALAQPLTELNTPFHEDGVFIHPDGKTMFFSSEGHNSMGGYDIFESQMGEDGKWGKPKNIGYPLNTTDDDIFFVTSASGKRAYYSSIRDDGYGDKDLYVISMLSFKEKPLTLLIGKISSADGSDIPEDIHIYVTDNETGENVGTYKPRARDNKFVIIIPPGSDYHLDYTYNDSTFYKDDIFVPENSAYQEIQKGITLGSVDFSTIPKKAKPAKTEKQPTPKYGSKNPAIEGNLKYGNAGAVAVLLNLKDNDKHTVANTTTDGSGNFMFENLTGGSKYFITIDGSNSPVPEDAQMSIRDQESGAMLPVSKLANGSFAFETLPFMEAEEITKIETKDEVPMKVEPKKEEKKVAVKEEKKTEAMPKKPVKAAPVMPAGGDYIMHEVRTGETFFNISVRYNLRFDVAQAANPNVGDLIYEGDEIKMPVPREVMLYQEFFDYNVTELKKDDDYNRFIAEVEKAVSSRGKARIMIESSASRVPTSKFGDNEKLADLRAETSKTMIIESMKEKGIGADKLEFACISTFVHGPDYQNDASENRETYKTFQYVKVIVK